MNKVVAFFKSQIGKEIVESPSPVGMWLRPVLINVEEGSITADIKIRDEMSNPAGTVHGGIYALIADEIIGATIATLDLPVFFASVNLNTDFIYPVKKGEIVTAKTEIIRKGKNIIHTECKIYNSEKKLVAKACSNNIKTKNS